MRQGSTFMNDLIEKRLANIVERPGARQLWAMKPSFSSARQIASSPSFQFQLGIFSRWAWKTNKQNIPQVKNQKHLLKRSVELEKIAVNDFLCQCLEFFWVGRSTSSVSELNSMLRNVPLLPTREKILHFSRHDGCDTVRSILTPNRQNIVKLSLPSACSFDSILSYCLMRNTHNIQEANIT